MLRGGSTFSRSVDAWAAEICGSAGSWTESDRRAAEKLQAVLCDLLRPCCTHGEALCAQHDVAASRGEPEGEARRRADDEKRRRLESLGVLAGGIAHDFNNLLTGILGHSALALRDLSAPSSSREHIAQIELAAERAAELGRQMLAYSRGVVIESVPVDINALAAETAALLRTTVSEHATVFLDLAADLPLASADPTELRQVVMNLLLNASDALGERPGHIAVTTRSSLLDAAALSSRGAASLSPGRYVEVEVRDTGCGMDAATQARIFEPLFTTKRGGHGLGLGATLDILRARRGALHVKSEPGRGSTFTVLLPAVAPLTAPLHAEAKASIPPPP